MVEAWEGHGPTAKDELKEAYRLLDQLKKKARGASEDATPTKALPLPRKSEFVSTVHSPSRVRSA